MCVFFFGTNVFIDTLLEGARWASFGTLKKEIAHFGDERNHSPGNAEKAKGRRLHFAMPEWRGGENTPPQ